MDSTAGGIRQLAKARAIAGEGAPRPAVYSATGSAAAPSIETKRARDLIAPSALSAMTIISGARRA
jgi:hypothetical protein